MYGRFLHIPNRSRCLVNTKPSLRPLVSIRKVSYNPSSEPSRPFLPPLPHDLVTPRSRSTTGHQLSEHIKSSNKPIGSQSRSNDSTIVGNTSANLSPPLARNQRNQLSEDLSAQLSAIVQTFKAPIRYAIGYGSGVFPQKSYDLKKEAPMLDFVFAVSYPNHWHSLNLEQNPKHYALPVRWLGSAPIAWLQEKGPGAGIWFNVQQEVNGKLIKYGVISVDTLCNDLLNWDTLYVSGRMQKPVCVVRDDARVRLAQQVNLSSALRTALLMLPEHFNEPELYSTIASLSYTGDFRMKWGENPRKIENIVDRQIEHFEAIYRPLLSVLSDHVTFVGHPTTLGDSRLQQSMEPRSRAELLKKLPRGLKQKIETDYDRQWNLQLATAKDGSTLINKEEILTSSDEMSLLVRMVTDPGFDQSLRRAVSLIVGPPAFNQSMKGIISAGAFNSVRYATSKVLKRWSS